MRPWLLYLGGLLIWAAHFLAIYVAATVFPGTRIARCLTVSLTIVALGALLLLIYQIHGRARAHPSAGTARWLDTLAFLGAGLAGVAILYQTLPAFIS
jgi:hypothetical protein